MIASTASRHGRERTPLPSVDPADQLGPAGCWQTRTMAFFRRSRPDSGEPSAEPPSATGAKATETFKDVLSQHWGPALRDLGFKGSGRVYVLPDERDWVMLGFQSSTASSAKAVKFTINLMVAGKRAWEEAREQAPHLAAKPSPNTLGGPQRYVQRIGFLTHGRDHWWWLRADEDPQLLIDEITNVIVNVAVPKLRQEMDDQSPGPRGAFEGVTKRES
jgi:hypothetical protein